MVSIMASSAGIASSGAKRTEAATGGGATSAVVVGPRAQDAAAAHALDRGE
jgi:hypothetical protein